MCFLKYPTFGVIPAEYLQINKRPNLLFMVSQVMPEITSSQCKVSANATLATVLLEYFFSINRF